jgi:predicted phage gp36 major capsid-like protein
MDTAPPRTPKIPIERMTSTAAPKNVALASRPRASEASQDISKVNEATRSVKREKPHVMRAKEVEGICGVGAAKRRRRAADSREQTSTNVTSGMIESVE